MSSSGELSNNTHKKTWLLGLLLRLSCLCLLIVCGVVHAEGSGFLSWAFDADLSVSTASNPLVFTAQASSTFSDMVVAVLRSDGGDSALKQGPNAHHPFRDLSDYGDVSYTVCQLEQNTQDIFMSTTPLPWNSITILHATTVGGAPSLFDNVCLFGTQPGSVHFCGLLLAVTAVVLPGSPTSLTPIEGVTPIVYVTKQVTRRTFMGSPDVINTTFIPLVPTVDANNKTLEGVVPWRCGRIVETASDGYDASSDCTIQSPEQHSLMHRGCNPPLGTFGNANVSTTVALTWNGTVYMFHPLELAVRTLSCLSSIVLTPPVHCYDYSDLIFTMPKGAVWGFLEMTYPLSARPPPWTFLDATPLVSSKCLVYIKESVTNNEAITLHDLGMPFANGAPVPTGAILATTGNCTPSITTTLVDVVYSTNITDPLGCGLPDGLFTTASTLFVTLCGGTADFHVVSPTIAYMQQAASPLPVVIRNVGSLVVPFPSGFTGVSSPNEFMVSVTRHGTLTRLPGDVTVSKTAYNTLATSAIYTIALAVPSVGYRNQSTWAKANNKTYGGELDSYVSVVTATSTYVPGFEATIGREEGGDMFVNLTMTHVVVQSAFFSSLDVHHTDSTVALLDPKDYYVSANATQEFCQYGPCEWAVPVPDRITAVLGFCQLQQLPPVAPTELLSAAIVLEATCGGTTPYETQSTSALISIHREILNATALWLLREAMSVTITTMMVSLPMNVSSGRRMNFREANVYANRMDGNMTASAAIPPGTLSLYGGTSFLQQAVMIDPYDGIVGDVSARGATTNVWLAGGNPTPETLMRISSNQLAASDLFPIRTPALSSQAVAVETFSSSGSLQNYLQPQHVLSKFVHELRLMATLPRTTFYPTVANNGSVSSDLPALTTCMYQLNDNGVPSINSQCANLNTFLRYTNSSRSNLFARWLYATLDVQEPNYVFNEASYIQLHLGNNRYGTRRFNTQVLLAVSAPNVSVPSCRGNGAHWEFSVSVMYGALSAGTVMEGGPTIRSARIIDEGLEVSVNQTFLPMFVGVGGAVAITQSYCSRVAMPPIRDASLNVTSVTLSTQVEATASGIVIGQRVLATTHPSTGARNFSGSTHTASSISYVFSAAVVTGSASYGILQPFGNVTSPLQWTASDRHASRVSGGNVTSMSAPFGSGGRVYICQGTTVLLMNQQGESASYDVSTGSGGTDTNIPCPPNKATCTCVPSSVQASADETVAFVSFVYKEHFNASSIYPNTIEETLVVFFNFSDASLLGWVSPPTIRHQMGNQCPNSNYSTAPFRISSQAELPLATLQATIGQVTSAHSTYSASPMIRSSDVVAGLVAAVPGTRCVVVWIAARNQIDPVTATNVSSVQTFVFTSMSLLGTAFSGVVTAFFGTPFITISLLPPSGVEFNCSFCTPGTLLSLPIVDIVEAIVTAYQPISDKGISVSRRYDYPFAMVPWVVNTSVLYLLTVGEYRITIQGYPAVGEDVDVNGCTLNVTIPCVANFSKMVMLVSNLYSEADTPPLYEVDLVACHTVPLNPSVESDVLCHLPVDGTCRLLYNETRRNVIFTDSRQGVSAYEFLSNIACVVFGSVVCFRLSPAADVVSVALAVSLAHTTIFTFDLFSTTPVTSFASRMAVFNPPGYVPLPLYYPPSNNLPGLYWSPPTTSGTNFSDCDSLALSGQTLALMCAVSGASVGDPKRLTVCNVYGGLIIASNGPYGVAGMTPVISNDGTYIIFINNKLTLSVSFLNVLQSVSPLSLSGTVCGVVGDASYTTSFDNDDGGDVEVVVTSLHPNIPAVRRSLGRSIRASCSYMYIGDAFIGSVFNVDDTDASTLFTDLFPNGGSTDLYSYRIEITDTVTLIQQSRGAATVSSDQKPASLQSAAPTAVDGWSDGAERAWRNSSITSTAAPLITAVPSFTFSTSGCFACIVVDAFSPTAQTGQCPSVCTVDALSGIQYRYTAHGGGMTEGIMLIQTKQPSNSSFSLVGGAGTIVLTFPTWDPNSTLVNSHYVFGLRATQDLVPCGEGATAVSVPLTTNQVYRVNLLGDASKYLDVLSVDVVPIFGNAVVSRTLSIPDAAGVAGSLTTTLQYVSKRSVFTVESHASLLHPLGMAIGILALPIPSSDPFATVQSVTLANGGSLSLEAGGQTRQLSNYSTGWTPLCDASKPPMGEIGGVGDLPPPGNKYLSIEWSGSPTSLWGAGYVRARHPLPLTYLLHRVPSMNDEERNMQIPTLDVEYSNIQGTGGFNLWSSDDAVSCKALPAGAASYDSNVAAGGLIFNTNTDMPPPVVCPTKCTPNYTSCSSLTKHFFDSYLFHTTHITGQPFVLPVGPLTQACWDTMPEVSRFQSAVGYFQQSDIVVSDWTFGRIAQLELYCTTDGQVAVTATVPDATESGLQYTNARHRVLLRLVSDYDAALGTGFKCTHCMYFMLEGVSAQPFLVMLVGSVKGLFLCYLFYFVGRLAERKKRRRMTYVVTRGDLLDRLDAVTWVIGLRRKERRATSDTGEETSGIKSPRLLDEFAASLRRRERMAAQDGLFSMTIVELILEKRQIQESIRQVEHSYYGEQARSSCLSRFLHRVIPNPIDLAIFLLLRLLSFKKHEDMVRVRKVIARTFSSATLSRTELAAHLGVVLSGSHHPRVRLPSLGAVPPERVPSYANVQSASPLTGEPLSSSSPLLSSSCPRPVVEVEADQRWYAFARFFAEHLTSEEHVWLVKTALDTPPPLQSENATIHQNAELRHTHLLLHTIYLLYCSLMDRVGTTGSLTSGPQGVSITSRLRKKSSLQVADPLAKRASNMVRDAFPANKGEEETTTVPLDSAVTFLRHEVTAYVKEWVQLGCLNLPHPTCRPPPRESPLHTHASPNAASTFPALNVIEHDSDFSDVDETTPSSAKGVGARQVNISRAERNLQFQMDALQLLRAHASDVSFAIEGDSRQHVTKVRFASRIEDSYTPAAQSDEDTNANTEGPLTSSNFVKSVHIFQSTMRGEGVGDGLQASSSRASLPVSTFEPDVNTPGSNQKPEATSFTDLDDFDLDRVSDLIAKEHDAYVQSLSTADMVLQMLRYSHEFNRRIEKQKTHFEYSKMYTQQLDEALAPNAFLILYGIAAALFAIVVYAVEVLSKTSSNQDKYTAFEVYQCIFFRFVNTTTFPTLLVDIFSRADQIACNPSSADDDEGFFGRLIPIVKGPPKEKRELVDRAARRTFAHRARSIASDKLLLLTLFLFSPPLITHILPGCVLYAWLLITPVVLFFGFESWISTRLEGLDASLAALGVPATPAQSLAGSRMSVVQVEDEEGEAVRADDIFLPVLLSMEEEEAKLGILARMRRSLDPTTTIFVVRSLLRVVFIFLLMVVISASYTYMAVYVYAKSPLVAQPPDTGVYRNLYGGVTTYERTGSYSASSYLGAIVTDYTGRSIDCILETIFTKFAVMVQTGLVSIF